MNKIAFYLCVLLALSLISFSSFSQVYDWYDISSASGAGYSRQSLATFDSQGNVYTIGSFSGQINYTIQDPDAILDDDLGISGQQISNSIVKRNPNGEVIWAGNIDHVFGGISDAIVDNNDNLIVGGTYSGAADMDLGENSFNMPWSTQSAFVAKYSPNGDLLFAKALAQPIGFNGATSSCAALHHDDANNIYCSIGASGNFDLNPGEDVLEYNSSAQVGVITKLNENGEYLFSKVGKGDFYANLSCFAFNAEDQTISVLARGRNFEYGDPNSLIAISLPDPDVENILLTMDLNGGLVTTSFDLPQEVEPRDIKQKSSGEIVLFAAFDDDQEIQGESVFSISASGNNNYLLAVCSAQGEVNGVSTIHLDQNSPAYHLELDEDLMPYFSIAFDGMLSYTDVNGQQTIQASGEIDAFVGKLNESAQFEWGIVAGGIASDDDWTLNDYPGENVMIMSTGFRQQVNFGGIIGEQTTSNFLKGVVAKIDFCTLEEDLENINACDEYIVNGTSIEESMLLQVTEINLGECIINQELNVQIWPSFAADTSIIACESIVFGDQTFEESGTYLLESNSVHGCDSITNVNFILTILNPTATLNDGVFTASNDELNYQWGFCDDNFVAIDGATEISFMPSVAGDYMLQVDDGNCTEFSECFTITEDELNETVSVSEFNNQHFILYPNPSSGFVDLSQFSKMVEIKKVQAFNGNGQEVQLQWDKGDELRMNNLPDGLYMLLFDTSSGLVKKMLVLKH
ncbi:MAG: T9SS type A sorting domain-containing protein [Flavobacteriaceae bacterium]|nr:T9SS type A sorting domain-containing protein [Flavobacteriaceae bacterium]